MRGALFLTGFLALAIASCAGKSDDDDGSGTGASAGSGGSSSSKGGTSSGGSSSSKGGTSSGGAGGGGSDSGGSASGGESGARGGGSSCPPSPPMTGDPCTPAGGLGFSRAECSWGDDPRPHCRTTATCTSNDEWQVNEPAAPDCEGDPLPAACPEAAPESGTVCDEDNLNCWYDDGSRCTCSPCQGGSAYPNCQVIDPPEWSCRTPMAGCENPAAQAGDPCEQEGLECGLDCELPITCQDGAWVWGQNMCPICAAPDTPIETPSGPRPIASLRVGDLVYSVDHGATVLVPIARTGSTVVSRQHQVVRLTLSDGGVIAMSPGHPTADGRLFGDLLQGGDLDDTHGVVSAELVDYAHDRTYDILPRSSTGTYFAAGALVGSTLAR